MTIRSELQTLDQGVPLVDLYNLDLTSLGGTVYYFTSTCYPDGTQVVWQYHTYLFIPIQSTGWEVMGSTTQGSASQPTPTITISNANKVLLTAVVAMGNLVGAKLTRYRTFQKFLDNQSAADQTQYLGPDIFYINQKTSHTKHAISFQLINPIDMPGKQLPGRQVLKDGAAAFPGVLVWR
jgi:lambda family phage minor tail protein L